MKRSEMEKHIELMLEAGGSNHYSYSPRNHAVYILDNLLKLGMLPPRWIPEDHGYIYGDEPSGEPNGFKISVSKWEPEDV